MTGTVRGIVCMIGHPGVLHSHQPSDVTVLRSCRGHTPSLIPTLIREELVEPSTVPMARSLVDTCRRCPGASFVVFGVRPPERRFSRPHPISTVTVWIHRCQPSELLHGCRWVTGRRRYDMRCMNPIATDMPRVEQITKRGGAKISRRRRVVFDMVESTPV